MADDGDGEAPIVRGGGGSLFGDLLVSLLGDLFTNPPELDREPGKGRRNRFIQDPRPDAARQRGAAADIALNPTREA